MASSPGGSAAVAVGGGSLKPAYFADATAGGVESAGRGRGAAVEPAVDFGCLTGGRDGLGAAKAGSRGGGGATLGGGMLLLSAVHSLLLLSPLDPFLHTQHNAVPVHASALHRPLPH